MHDTKIIRVQSEDLRHLEKLVLHNKSTNKENVMYTFKVYISVLLIE